jgi:hypothetical protein
MMRRNREPNVFGLSLMDAISGAMGAFLIIMLLLSRYYDSDPTSGQKAEELQQELDQAQMQLEELRQRMEGMGEYDDLRPQLMQALADLDEARLKAAQLQTSLAEANAEIRRLRKLLDQLDRVHPFVVMVHWECQPAAQPEPKMTEEQADMLAEVRGMSEDAKRQFKEMLIRQGRLVATEEEATRPVAETRSTREEDDVVAIYLWSNATTSEDVPMPPFEPGKLKRAFFAGDAFIPPELVKNTLVWFVKVTSPGSEDKLYATFTHYQEKPRPCRLSGGIYSAKGPKIFSIPEVTLTDRQRWTFVGTVKHLEDGAIDFKVASAEERSRERQAVEERMRGAKAGG